MSLFYGAERFVEKNILPFFCRLLSVFKKKKPLDQQPKSILVLRFWGLGETILTLPLLKALKDARPDAKITVLCTRRNYDVFFAQPFIDECRTVWTWQLPIIVLASLWRYDLAMDTEPHFAISAILAFFMGKRSIGFDYGERAKLYDANVHYNDRQHVVYTFCDLLSPLGIAARPAELVRLRYGEAARKAADLRFEANNIRPKGGKPIIGIHAFCGPTAPWRAWPKERFAELIDRITARYDCTVILTGSGAEAAGNEEIISMLKRKGGVYNFPDMAASTLFYLISQYDLMVSNDTGPMHIAAAQGVPAIGLFGPNTPERFGPFPPGRNTAIYHPTPGHPVINVHINEFRPCDGECMKLITVDEVFAAADSVLGRRKTY
ncbi:MAG: glycosyltransferase family 9 protein [Candidatus ainarchaeum sp.]|nr:glycosyltransferase family 9 protein [Candidatus ainarchaeum sp.]